MGTSQKETVMRKITAALIFVILLSFIISLASSEVRAEEGMWTLDNLPTKYLKEKYGFAPEKDWLDLVQRASVRFNDGGSGSWVSATGLVLTNHHVAVGQLQKMSDKGKDYVRDGYYARTPAEEIKCPDLELNVLITMENVTERVKNACKGLSDREALKARKKEMARLENESLKKTGLRSDVVTLYHGGEYWLYAYKRYRDVRLVMAPEKQIAFYGGNSDNFTYPRYDLDFALFRVYEDNKPVSPSRYLRFSTEGASDGELVFVSGHPGTTKRFITSAQYEFNRDFIYPTNLEQMKALLIELARFSKKGEEARRRAETLTFSYDNSLKAYEGEYKGLQDPQFTKKFFAMEKKFRSDIDRNPALRREVGSAWDIIAAAQKKLARRNNEMTFKTLRGYRLPQIAQGIVFYVKETRKPDGERLDGYHDSQLDTWRFINLSPAPVYRDLEEHLLAFQMKRMKEKLGEGSDYVKVLLGGMSPEMRAHELIQKTKLADPSYRKSLVEGGEEALKKSDDPLIRLALNLEPGTREIIKWRENIIDSAVTPASEAIERARFKVYGKIKYPDATFTLRLAFGRVKGYPLNGTMAPPFTTFYGLYDRYCGFGGKGDWALPPRYCEHKDEINLSTRLNFALAADITGGNSGSPVVNRRGELVGLIFDGNIESLVGRFIYDDIGDRAVAVHTAGIIEALQKLYDARGLAEELTGSR
jgi:hypothetical protein